MSAAVSRSLLEARIEREREELAATLDVLREQAQQRLDLREYVRRHPNAWVGGALLVGFWLAVRR